MKKTRPILLHKARFVIDAMEHYTVRSFADLGGSWGVHGGYSLQALLPFGIERAYLIDGFIPEGMQDRFSSYPEYQFVKGAFGDPDTVAKVEPVDAFFMFDILLHQVDPDWDQILLMYAQKTQHMFIYNQQWVGGNKTIRLFDLGEDDYYKHSIFGARATDEAREEVAEIYKRLKQVKTTGVSDPALDAPNIWQWGITTPDLIKKMWDLGFTMDYMRNFGQFPGIPGFENHGFWFTRR